MRISVRTRTIRQRLILYILLFLVLPFCLVFYFAGNSLRNAVEEKVMRSMAGAQKLAASHVDGLTQQMIHSINYISLDRDMVRLLKQPEAYDPFESLQISQEIIRSIHNTYLGNCNDYETMLDFAGNLYTSWYAMPEKQEALREERWYQRALANPYSYIWTADGSNFTFGDKTPLFTVVKAIQDTGTMNWVGVAAVSVPETDIGNILSGLDGECMLTDSKGILLYSRMGGQVGTDLSQEPCVNRSLEEKEGQFILEIDGRRMVVCHSTLPGTDWRLIQKVPYTELFSGLRDASWLNYGALALLSLVFLGATGVIAHKISRPLRQLAAQMEGFDCPDRPAHPIPFSDVEEISTLIQTYNRMLGRIEELLQRVRLEYEQKEEFRFRALQAQINPHFILNTLNNIKWMAYIRSNPEVGEMLSSLAAVMESCLGRGDRFLSLEKELDYIQHYVTLQKMKYNEKLTIRYSVPEELRCCRIPAFILQPLVENCIYHGIDPIKRQGVIQLSVQRENSDLRIQVRDNGVGIPPVRLEELKRMLDSEPDAADSRRVGLKNVHDRIRLQYGERYGAALSSLQGEWTIVELRVPCEHPEEEGDIPCIP